SADGVRWRHARHETSRDQPSVVRPAWGHSLPRRGLSSGRVREEVPARPGPLVRSDPLKIEATLARLLVSVRSPDEALAAIKGGADIIDVKEPAHGPLGRADAAVWRAVREAVPPSIPVSVALGEWDEWRHGDLKVPNLADYSY